MLLGRWVVPVGQLARIYILKLGFMEYRLIRRMFWSNKKAPAGVVKRVGVVVTTAVFAFATTPYSTCTDRRFVLLA